MNKAMSVYGVIALTLCCLLSALQAGCGGSEGKVTLASNVELNGPGVESFTLTDLSDHELTQGLVFDVVNSDNQVAVVIKTVAPLQEAFGSLKFDTNSYAPVETKWNEDLLDGESVYLVLTNQYGEVPFGVVRLPEGSELAEEIITVKFKREPQLATRRISKAPLGDVNAVGDLAATPVEGGTVELEWSERNVGDYDNNGEVGVADITPIAQNYLAVLGDGEGDEDWEQLIDGDGSGDIGIADITPIATNYLSLIAGYHVYRGIELPDGEVSWEFTPIKTLPRPAATLMKRIGYKITDDPLGVGQ